MLTLRVLQSAGANPINAQRWLEPLRQACAVYEINTPPRIAAFVAQLAHESMGFAVTTEL